MRGCYSLVDVNLQM